MVAVKMKRLTRAGSSMSSTKRDVIDALLSAFALTPTWAFQVQLFGSPLSWVLVPLSSIRLAQHLRPALSSMPIGKNFPFFHLLGLPQNA
jgi:hypothetical protein